MRGKIIKKENKILAFLFLCLSASLFLFSSPSLANIEQKHHPANSPAVVNHARELLLSVVDTGFRGTWVIDPRDRKKTTKEKTFNSLANIKVGSSQEAVRKLLKEPQETKNNGKIWIYGIKNEDGTYKDLLEVFFDEKLQSVIGVIAFDPKRIVEKIGVNIGDPIDKMISAYGEPLDEKDFIEDPDNKNYLGLYYLYPRSGIGFLVGQDEEKNNLLVYGVLVFGKT